ncbi:MAG: hypothetical protein JW751_02020 [Polyangiaceae bacterium]|nr:hypothetical protein [Polyangiaceae bacterium]
MPPLSGKHAAVLAVALSAPPLSAAPNACPEGNHPWVHLTAAAVAPSIPLARTIEHMRAELAPSGIDVCTIPRADAPPALATVRLAASDEATVSISAEVDDAVTSKQLSRRIDLSTTSPDARALTVALGATELLRASWAEVGLPDAPTGAVPVPREVETDLAKERRRGATSGSPRATVEFAVAGEEFSGGLRELGLDLRVTERVWRRLTVGGRLGARRADRESSPYGRVDTDGWLLGISMATPITTLTDRAGVDLVGRADAFSLTFRGTPTEMATGGGRSSVMLTLAAGFGSWVRFAKNLRGEVEAVAGGAPRSVTVTDGTSPLVSTHGMFVAGSVGLGLSF